MWSGSSGWHHQPGLHCLDRFGTTMRSSSFPMRMMLVSVRARLAVPYGTVWDICSPLHLHRDLILIRRLHPFRNSVPAISCYHIESSRRTTSPSSHDPLPFRPWCHPARPGHILRPHSPAACVQYSIWTRHACLPARGQSRTCTERWRPIERRHSKRTDRVPPAIKLQARSSLPTHIIC